ncbi:SDR family NAD(P)-dependent oxidoreductase [Pseudoruegeria sp. SK021]|uniref:SDR family NAD(P)-dependent oxidoreductase n=1 Tax=Pseudoruegeria sp. SK021 TaxID=1933035 RepID=UPI000A2636DB|nr:SDR family oxidoreductase [Pseudoruegeria sp. SK021]OSP55814.1 3-oxoacyl-ACP reductase [Pseudoruegeria sp. SK021]
MTQSGKIAVVTGAAGAIGKSIVSALVSSGAHVVMMDLDAAKLEQLSAKYGDAVSGVQVDLANTDQLLGAMASILEKFNRVDILVNNAGILSNNKMAETTLEEWRKVHAINLDAAFLLSKAVLPGMAVVKWGRIVNVASYAAKSGGLTAGTAYSVSKSGMIGLTFSTARETTAKGITVNAIAPAYVMSPMVSEQLTDAQRAKQLSEIPVGRFCEPEEVAHAVTFLASPLAGFITGEVIDMNGGLYFD